MLLFTPMKMLVRSILEEKPNISLMGAKKAEAPLLSPQGGRSHAECLSMGVLSSGTSPDGIFPPWGDERGAFAANTQLRMLTMRLNTMVWVASPQYAMPLYAITMPTMPDTRREQSPMMASSFCFICRKRMARGTMLNEAMKKPKK